MYENSAPKERPLNQKASTKPNEDSGKDPITNVASFLQKISENPKDGTVLYRGHGDRRWLLTPSVGRTKKFKDNEKTIFLDFKRQYYLYADDRPSTDIDTLFLAQHFELPTRLLDWSYNPLVSLWFACQEENVDGCVYTKTIIRGEDTLKEGHQLDFDIFNENDNIKQDYLFLVPDYTVRRYFNQKGMFIWFRNPSAFYNDLDDEPLIIKKEYKRGILKELSTMGITKAFLLPSLENLCNDIKYKYSK